MDKLRISQIQFSASHIPNSNAKILEQNFKKTLKFKPHLICTPECSNIITNDKNFRVIEKENRLQIYNDSFGVNDFELGLTSKVINTINSNYQESVIASATLTKIDDFKIQRGIYDEDYKYLPYDNYDRDYAKSRNKFMIMHHAFNAKTNTYFWGMNGIHNSSSNFVTPSAVSRDSETQIKTAAAPTQFIYFGNFYYFWIEKKIFLLYDHI